MLNVRGSLGLIKRHKDSFGVIKELLSNAVESCLIKKDTGSKDKIEISINTSFAKNGKISSLEIIDNGIGFNKQQ